MNKNLKRILLPNNSEGDCYPCYEYDELIGYIYPASTYPDEKEFNLIFNEEKERYEIE